MTSAVCVDVGITRTEHGLVGDLDPREIMEEMGRVERLIEGFEREVYL